MRTVAIIQARMGSTRLPGKVLAEAAGKPLLVHMVERDERCQTLDGVIVATPGGREQQSIWDVALDHGCDTIAFDVPEADVLGRVLAAARWTKADVIVELTGDCPLIDPLIVDQAVTVFRRVGGKRKSVEISRVYPRLFVSTSRDSFQDAVRAYPRGMDVRIFSTESLAEVDRLTNDSVDREHVSLYMWEHQDRFVVHNLAAPEELRDDVRLTVDTPDDLELVRQIFEHFAPRNDFSLVQVLTLVRLHPILRALNVHVEQKVVR